MSDVNFFDNNLDIFERFCPKLVEDVKNANCVDYEFCKSKSGDLNIRKRNEQGDFYFHSTQDPKKEAEIWYNSIYEIENVDILVVFGIGVGYYYDTCKKWLKKDPQRLIVFVEHDFALLNMFFQTKQAKEVLSDPQVAIIGTKEDIFDQVKLKLGYLDIVARLLPEHFSQFTELKSYSKVHDQLWKNIKKALQFRATEITQYGNFFKPRTLQESALNSTYNYWRLPESKLFYPMEGAMKGIPAVICGAGPSLQDDLPVLKKYKDHALIIGAGTGMNILNKNDIIPRIGVVVDPYDTTRSRILTNYSYEVPFFYKLSANYEALKLLHGEKIFFRGVASYGFDAYFENQLDLDKYPPIHSPLTTTHACLGIASMLGCNPIILIGVDLAYTDRKRYPDEALAHPLDKRKEHFHPSGLHRQHIVISEATKGGVVETRVDWLLEASFFEQFSKRYPEVRLINATSRGLLIPELPSLNFEEIAQKELGCIFDIENLIHAEIQNCSMVNATTSDIEMSMVKWRESLDASIRLLSEMLEELSVKLKRLQGNPDLVEDYRTQKFSELEEKLHSEDVYRYFLQGEKQKFTKLFFRRQYPLLYRSEQFEENEKIVKEIEYEIGLYLFLTYYSQIVRDAVVSSLESEGQNRAEDSDKEMSEAEVMQIENDKDDYRYEDGKLIIHDEELNFHLEEVFITERIPSNKKPDKTDLFHYASTKNNHPEGECLICYQSGERKGEWFYKDGKIHGPSTFYSEDGTVLAKGWYVENKRQGKNYQFYSSGRIYSLKRYKDGESHGKQEFYYESGAKKSTMSFVNGKLEGSVKLYYSDGEMKREIQFSHGELNGFERLWDASGQLIQESEYCNNQPVGISRSWYATGQIKEEKKYYDSAENYDLTSWNEEGKIIEKLVFMPQGFRKELTSEIEDTMHSLKNLKESLIQQKKSKD